MNKLLKRVKANDFTLGIIGIGRVGLPLSLVFARCGFRVIGMDRDQDYVDKIKRGEKPFYEAGMEELLRTTSLLPTTDIAWGAKESDVLILCVGTPLTQGYRQDYTQLYSALSQISEVPLQGKLIIVRSTVPPGTVEERIAPLLEKKTGLRMGKDFGIVVCPERILEGKAIEEIRELPEIIGGTDPVSMEIAEQLFRKINPKKRITRTTLKGAELAKLFSNVYRYVNFALANEFALLAEEFGEDSWEIIKMLNDGYARGGVPRPGLAGGPCLSKDGYFLTSNIAFPDFILMASRLNEFIPQYIVNRLKRRLQEKGKPIHRCKIAVLGLAFKAGIDDTRYSPSVSIVGLLESENADVLKHDPYVEGTDSFEDAVADADAIVLATNHSEFEGVCQRLKKLKKHKPDCILFDCWGMISAEEAGKCGLDYLRFGSGRSERKEKVIEK